jgi:hypothetical protein
VTADVQPPFFVLIERALRDEGTSYHYVPPARFAEADAALANAVARALDGIPTPLLRGASWTTDAPFRESAALIESRRSEGIISAEMEAAALFAMGQALRKPVTCIAHVTNAMATRPDDFEKGGHDRQEEALDVCWRALIAALAHTRRARVGAISHPRLAPTHRIPCLQLPSRRSLRLAGAGSLLLRRRSPAQQGSSGLPRSPHDRPRGPPAGKGPPSDIGRQGRESPAGTARRGTYCPLVRLGRYSACAEGVLRPPPRHRPRDHGQAPGLPRRDRLVRALHQRVRRGALARRRLDDRVPPQARPTRARRRGRQRASRRSPQTSHGMRIRAASER